MLLAILYMQTFYESLFAHCRAPRGDISARASVRSLELRNTRSFTLFYARYDMPLGFWVRRNKNIQRQTNRRAHPTLRG